MTKLKTILLSKYFYLCLILLTILYCLITLKLHFFKTNYNSNCKHIVGIITNIKKKKNFNILEIKCGESFLVYDYEKEKYSIGDTVKVFGHFKRIDGNSNFNLFNYRNYLMSKRIYFKIDKTKIYKIKSGHLFYSIKNLIIKRINKINNPYLNAFILGDNTMIDTKIYQSYQINGINHLFAISGMHVYLIISIVTIMFKKIIKEKYIVIINILILFFYLFLTCYTKSISRAVFLYIGIAINKRLGLSLSNFQILIILLCISLFLNPYNLYNISFLLTFIVTISITINSKFINQNSNYFRKLFKVSLISFISTIPVIVNNFFQINILSILLNLIFVPFISIIIFPFSLIVFIFPKLNLLFRLLILVLENLSLYFSHINFFKVTLCHINIIVFIIYYIAILVFFISLNHKKYKYSVFLVLIFFFHFNYNNINSNFYYILLDVNQGDSSLIIFPKNKGNILIDTGGLYNKSILNNTILPLLKSKGLKSIDYLILTHGDYDHMGEAINLVNNFKVEKVIFNCGEFNDLENELIKVLDKKKIKYYSCIKEINIDNAKLYFLQTKEYDNENDNSNVIYTELNGYKFMFMGDAGIEKEKDILDKYNISDIDVLKVGHHGSKTSSSKDFINGINPKYSIISVGKNNRYGHPNKEILNNLEGSKIYRTDQDGSIMFKIENNKLKIENCSP